MSGLLLLTKRYPVKEVANHCLLGKCLQREFGMMLSTSCLSSYFVLLNQMVNQKEAFLVVLLCFSFLYLEFLDSYFKGTRCFSPYPYFIHMYIYPLYTYYMCFEK